MTSDPSALQAIAVSAEDLLAAMESHARGDTPTVLRVTPPFSGRMRARLHVLQGGGENETVCIEPTVFFDDDAPSYPTPDETADELRTGDSEYSVENHRGYHERQVDEWRDTVLDHVRPAIAPPAIGHEVNVSLLGP